MSIQESTGPVAGKPGENKVIGAEEEKSPIKFATRRKLVDESAFNAGFK